MAQPRLDLQVRLDTELPVSLPVGRGNCLFVSGSCRRPGGPVSELRLLLDGREHRPIAQGMPGGRFWGYLPVEPAEAPGTVAIELVARLAGGQAARSVLGEVALEPSPPLIEAAAKPAAGPGPLVAICLATFEPPAELFERQIESLREQTHRRWVCLISDDCSSPESFERLRSVIGEDARFFVSRAEERRGAYRNFERALSMVPEEAELVAFCDQDDRWHPEKLAALAGRIGDANLAFSDMRIVDQRGAVVSETFWSYKRNNYTNLASLLLDNTVTGAASLFRRSLLELALPFPPAFEGSWHDHWLASVALATGRLAYLDRPLHDYVQHADAVTPAHPAAREAEAGRRRRPLSREGLRVRLAEGGQAYFRNVCRVGLAARTLEMRTREREATFRKRRAINRVARLVDPPEPALWLLLRLLRPKVGLTETLSFERSLLKSIAWRRVTASRARRSR